MKVSLSKKNKKTIDIVLLEVDNGFLLKKEGKHAKSLSSSTKNCGTFEEAIEECQKEIKGYQEKGYEVDNTTMPVQETEIFDKAKWHLNKDFPKSLKAYQAYIHTGFYIGWLINNHLISKTFEEENKDSINKFLRKELTGTQIYQEQLDGIFSSDELSDIGIKFTKYYFNFDDGDYLDDYDDCLVENLDSLFHVKDSWANFDKISKFIDKRFEEWKK